MEQSTIIRAGALWILANKTANHTKTVNNRMITTGL